MNLRTFSMTVPVLVALGASQALATSVNLDGRPLQLDTAPIVQAGRVFVPLRRIFESLGASVVYQNGTINATRRDSTVTLHIGSPQATVSGAEQKLDSPPFINGSTTYVPLRFVAQALGANVSYDNASSAVSITQRGYSPSTVVVPPSSQYSDVALRNVMPSDGSQTHSKRPTISANFSHSVDPNSVRITIDGLDVSNNATRSPSGIVYEPASPLQSMRHEVVLTGKDAQGRHFHLHWAFETQAGQNGVGLRIDGLLDGASVPSNFYVSGETIPHARIHIACGAFGVDPLNYVHERGSFVADTFADSTGHFSQNVVANAPAGGQMTLIVTAVDARNGQTVSRTRHLHVSEN